MARVVLGVDAAWTTTQPSGVALALEEGTEWRLMCVAPSYRHFIAAPEDLHLAGMIEGSPPNPSEILRAAERIAGRRVTLISVDMPLSRQPIANRRESDNVISRAYGARHAATHSPSATRPGRISDDLRAGFEAEGYPLRTIGDVREGLIECYPHPALIEYLSAPVRLAYKVAKRARYWPFENSTQRRQNIFEVWKHIASSLEARVKGVKSTLPLSPEALRTIRDWKSCEDQLDAIVCAAVGIDVLSGNAMPYGDEDSAIWVPKVEADT